MKKRSNAPADSLQHTPTPWHLSQSSLYIRADNGEFGTWNICEMNTHSAIFPVDAELIVRAVNSHEELVDLLEGLLEAGSDHWSEGTTAMVKAALARAKGESK